MRSTTARLLLELVSAMWVSGVIGGGEWAAATETTAGTTEQEPSISYI